MQDRADQYVTLQNMEFADEFCSHPSENRYPYKENWEVCTLCGEIVRPDDFIPFLPEHLSSYGANYERDLRLERDFA